MSSYPHINLLKKEEQRYQGTVSKKTIMALLVVVPLLTLILFGSIEWIQYRAAKDEYVMNQQQWQRLGPQYNVCKKEQMELAEKERVLQLINGWKKTIVPLSKVLSDLRDIIPLDIQLTQLVIEDRKQRSEYSKPSDFVVKYSLLMNGISVGKQDPVFNLHKELLKQEGAYSIFGSVKLGDMMRTVDSSGKEIHNFSIKGGE